MTRSMWMSIVVGLACAAPAQAARNGRIVVETRFQGQSAFVSPRLISVRPDGGGRRLLGTGLFPSATRDGRLVYDRYCGRCSASRRLRLVVARADGRVVRRIHIARSSAYPNAPDWPSLSPDGRWLAYGRAAAGRPDAEVCIARANGKAERVVATFSDGTLAASWSPDGRYLAVASGVRGLLVINARTGRVRVVYRGDAAGRPAFSPDGHTLLFVAPGASHEQDEVESVQLDGTGLRYLFPGDSPFWSPDGRLIGAVASDPASAQAKTEIIIRRPTGHVVTQFAMEAREATWLPAARS